MLAQANLIMRGRQEELAVLMSREQGKPHKASMNEVGYAAGFLAWFSEEANVSGLGREGGYEGIGE